METIVIAGGGAGGLELATRLGNRLGRRGLARIVLVDRSPTHFWKPLLHAVAAGKIDPAAHEISYAAHAAEHHFEFLCRDVIRLDRAQRAIELDAVRLDEGIDALPRRLLHYDRLVLAFGSVTNFFGVEGADRHSISLDTVAQAEMFRRRFLAHCMQASSRPVSRENAVPRVNIVIVGGGATGVELAAELSHTVRSLAKYKVHALDPARDVGICLIERGERLLPHLDPELSAAAAAYLRSRGIAVRTSTAVVRVDHDAVHDTDGQAHASSITVWAAGVEGPALATSLGLSLNRLRQIQVQPSLQSVDDPRVFAMGDCSSHVCPVRGTAVPPRAQVAHQQARFLADALERLIRDPEGSDLPSFEYRDYGSLVSLGRFAAVGMLMSGGRPTPGPMPRGLFVAGAAARFLYAMLYRLHILTLLGFGRMAAQSAVDWIRARVTPSVRLH